MFHDLAIGHKINYKGRTTDRCIKLRSGHLIFNTNLIQDPSVIFSAFFQQVISTRGTKVTLHHFGLEEQLIVVGLHRPQLGHVLGWLPVRHTRVIDARVDVNRGVLGLADVVVR